MDNKEDIIKKYKLEEAIKKLRKINEYTFYDSTMVEADDDADNPQGGDEGGSNGGAMPPTNNAQGDQGAMGGDPNAMGGDPNAMGGDPNAMGDNPGAANGDPNAMGGEMPQDNGMAAGDDANAADGGSPMDDGLVGNDGVKDVEMDTEQPGDEVIDVDDLTQSQETTEFKVDHVDDKLNKVLKAISKFNDAIAYNDQKIEDLKKEFEKRNPTAEETMNLRSLASHPFSESPEDYWEKQQKEHPNYRVISDNDIPTSEEQKEFEIRKSDIDNFNEREIMKSLGEEHLKLSDFLQF